MNVTESNLMVNIHIMQRHLSQTIILISKKYQLIFVNKCCVNEIINDESFVTHLFAIVQNSCVYLNPLLWKS